MAPVDFSGHEERDGSRATHEKNRSSARQTGAVTKEPSPARPPGGRRFRSSTRWTSALASSRGILLQDDDRLPRVHRLALATQHLEDGAGDGRLHRDFHFHGFQYDE